MARQIKITGALACGCLFAMSAPALAWVGDASDGPLSALSTAVASETEQPHSSRVPESDPQASSESAETSDRERMPQSPVPSPEQSRVESPDPAETAPPAETDQPSYTNPPAEPDQTDEPSQTPRTAQPTEPSPLPEPSPSVSSETDPQPAPGDSSATVEPPTPQDGPGDGGSVREEPIPVPDEDPSLQENPMENQPDDSRQEQSAPVQENRQPAEDGAVNSADRQADLPAETPPRPEAISGSSVNREATDKSTPEEKSLEASSWVKDYINKGGHSSANGVSDSTGVTGIGAQGQGSISSAGNGILELGRSLISGRNPLMIFTLAATGVIGYVVRQYRRDNTVQKTEKAQG